MILDESSGSNVDSPASVPSGRHSKSAGSTARSNKPKRLYGFGAERRSQPKTTDLIPKRWPAYSTLVALLVLAVAALNAMSIYADSLQTYIGDAGVSAFSLHGTGTFAAWFASTVMAAGAMVCLQVFYLRKHRCDDYRGSYRLWFWAAVIFLLCSVASSTELGAIVMNVSGSLLSTMPSAGPVPFLVVVGCVIFSAFVMLGLWETRISRGAVALIIIGWIAGLVSMLGTVPEVQQGFADVKLLAVVANGWLLLTTSSFLAVLTYARHVYLAANGMLPVRQPKAESLKADSKKKVAESVARSKQKSSAKPDMDKSAAKASTAETTAAEKQETSPNRLSAIREEAAAKKASSHRQKARGKTSQTIPIAAESDVEEKPKLSKAERRRQRKLERRQKRAA